LIIVPVSSLLLAALPVWKQRRKSGGNALLTQYFASELAIKITGQGLTAVRSGFRTILKDTSGSYIRGCVLARIGSWKDLDASSLQDASLILKILAIC
jgi:hypothetical protein